MNHIVSLTGHKGSGKTKLAFDLCKNSAIGYVKAYTDAPCHIQWLDCFNYVSKEDLDALIEEREVLYSSMVNGHRYVFFKDQLTSAYNILILDDYGVADLSAEYSNHFYSVKVVSKNQKDSDRVGVYLFNHEFDEVFDIDNDEIEDLEARIEANLMWSE